MEAKPTTAPAGAIYVCGACGKTSPTSAPSEGSSHGWDVSCTINAVLCTLSSLEYDEDKHTVVKATAYKTKKEDNGQKRSDS